MRPLHMILLLSLLLVGCIRDKEAEERLKWTMSQDHKDKRPYGTYLAFESLKYCFPGADIQTLSSGFRYTNMDNQMRYPASGRTLLILQGQNFYLSESEWRALKQFVSYGNEVVVFCSVLDNTVEKELGIEKVLGGTDASQYYRFDADHNNRNILTLAGDKDHTYGYKGHSIKSYFNISDKVVPVVDSAAVVEAPPPVDNSSAETHTDTTYSDDDTTYTTSTSAATDPDDEADTYSDDMWRPVDSLGYVYSHVNYIRFGSGNGHLTIHAAPAVLSNYFLLQPGNEQYLYALWHTLPSDITHVYWHDYHIRNTEASSIDILWRYPATRYALFLGLFAMAIYILFEGKRKQRIIPIIQPLKNDSVSFVETVGRLYYNKGNQQNLAEKMVQQFLEWIRTYYLLNTNLLNENFIQQLTIKSGQPEATVRGMVDMIHEIRLRDTRIDDPYLYQLYNTIQQFYKNHRI